MSVIQIPDAQTTHYEALVKAFVDGVVQVSENAEAADDFLDYAFAEEPESVVFYAGDMHDEDPDDRAEIIDLVGSRDLDTKIRYWTERLRELRSEHG